MEGHNKLHCEFGQCLSTQYCNLLEKHPDEKKDLGEHEKATESRGRQTGTTRRRTAGESGSSCISPKLLLLQSPRDVNPIQTEGGVGGDCARTDFEISPRSVNPIQTRGVGRFCPH